MIATRVASGAYNPFFIRDRNTGSGWLDTEVTSLKCKKFMCSKDCHELRSDSCGGSSLTTLVGGTRFEKEIRTAVTLVEQFVLWYHKEARILLLISNKNNVELFNNYIGYQL